MTFVEQLFVDNPAVERLLRQASKSLQGRFKLEGNTGRGVLAGGPCDRACCSIEIAGRDVRDRQKLRFKKVDSVIGAVPCDEGEHLYVQRRTKDGKPAVNIVGDIIYDWCPDEDRVRSAKAVATADIA